MELNIERIGGRLVLRTEGDREGAIELPLTPADIGDDVWEFTIVELAERR